MAKEDGGEVPMHPQELHTLADAPTLQDQSEQGIQQDKSEVVPKDFFFFSVPKHLRHDPDKPAHFGLFLNVVFALATTFSAYFTGINFPSLILTLFATPFDSCL